MSVTPTQRRTLSAVSLALGLSLLLVASDLFPGVERQPSDAPALIVALAGLVFIVAGCMALVGVGSRTNDLLAALLCFLFGVMGSWVAFFGPAEGFSGGLPFISGDANVSIGRVVFGIGALICFAISAWALRLYMRSPARADEQSD